VIQHVVRDVHGRPDPSGRLILVFAAGIDNPAVLDRLGAEQVGA
jgi:hypothetical protein